MAHAKRCESRSDFAGGLSMREKAAVWRALKGPSLRVIILLIERAPVESARIPSSSAPPMSSMDDKPATGAKADPGYSTVTEVTSSVDQAQEPSLASRKASSDPDFQAGAVVIDEDAIDKEEQRKNRRKIVLDSLELPSPPAYDLFVRGLSIGVPPPERYLPLPVPIPYPAFLRKKKDLGYLEQTILRDVDAKCGSGEMLAM